MIAHELLDIYYLVDCDLGDSKPESWAKLEAAILSFCSEYQPPTPFKDGVMFAVVTGLVGHPDQTGISPGFIAEQAFNIANAMEKEKEKRKGVRRV